MQLIPVITEEMLDTLRSEIAGSMGEKRLRHTLAVEREIVRLGELYLPDRIPELRAAALLHDLTKERSLAEQLCLCEKYALPISQTDHISPKTLHARTAVPLIRETYPAFATPAILDAVRKHTTGAREMSLFAKLLYLADYIEDTRTFRDCIVLRDLFADGLSKCGPTAAERLDLLDRILLISYDMTIACLMQEEAAISVETVDARNALIEKIHHS